MTQKNSPLEEAIAGTMATLDGEGAIYRRGDASAIILLEDRILTINANGVVYEVALGEWNALSE